MKLYLPQENKNEISDLQKGVMEKEIETLNKECPIDEGCLDLKKVYIIGNDEGAEAQIYIRNNTSLNLKLEGVPVHLTHNNTIVGIVCPDFKKLSEVPAKSIVPFKIQFNHENIYEPQLLLDSDIKIGVDIKIEKTINHKIENLPETLNYEQNKFIEEYCKNLNELRADTYDFNLVTISKEEDRTLSMAILIRNGYESDIKIDSLPIYIYNAKGLLICHDQFNLNGMIVNGRSASMFSLSIPGKFVPTTEENYDEFRVEFQGNN